MSSGEHPKFKCSGCGKLYSWKPEFAGKKAKCSKCALVMTVPAVPDEIIIDPPVVHAPAAPSPVDADAGLYDLAPAAQPAPSKTAAKLDVEAEAASGMYDLALDPETIRRPIRHAPVVAASTAGAAAAVVPGVLPYGGGRTRNDAEKAKSNFADSVGGHPWREVWLPAALVIAGVVLQVLQTMQGTSLTFMEALPSIGIRLIGGLILSFAGIAFVARAFEISFGAPGPAVLKAAAGCLLPPAIGAVIGSLVGHDSFFVKTMVSSMLMLPLSWVIFWWLFSLEFDEAMWLVVIIWLIQEWVVTFLLAMILSTGDFSGMIGPGSGGSSQDEEIEQALQWPATKEAKPWLQQTSNRVLGGLPNAQALKVVQRLLDAGAEKVSFVTDGPEASKIIITLPRDKGKRKAIIDVCNDLEKNSGEDVIHDDRQHYLEIDPPAMLETPGEK